MRTAIIAAGLAITAVAGVAAPAEAQPYRYHHGYGFRHHGYAYRHYGYGYRRFGHRPYGYRFHHGPYGYPHGYHRY